jgi:shikimate kinase/3-dehydroquinate synthase
LQNADPEKTLRDLLELRYPVYERADITVVSQDGPYETSVEAVLQALEFFMRFSADVPSELLTAPMPADPFQSPPNLPLPLKVKVDLGAGGYDILIGEGLLSEAGRNIAAFAPKARCAIVTDENLAKTHLAGLERALIEANIGFSTLVLPPGEASKSFPVFQHVCENIIAAKIERGDLILALGGGVIGDLAGFAAASVRRGMRFVQIPTSLLAQVDSSVGGKTGINSAQGKNLIGAFHQPSLVLADTGVLETLPVREFRAGYAEIVKYGAIGDERFFAWLEENWRAIFSHGPELAVAIAHSCAAKAGVVARDEHETGERALLNFGHTFGHALESLTHYDNARLVHGEGVAIGMACAFRFSVYLGLCLKEEQMRFEAHLRAAGLPVRIGEIEGFTAAPEDIVAAMAQDKKVERGALTFILTRRIGECFIAKGVESEKVCAFLTEDLKRV